MFPSFLTIPFSSSYIYTVFFPYLTMESTFTTQLLNPGGKVDIYPRMFSRFLDSSSTQIPKVPLALTDTTIRVSRIFGVEVGVEETTEHLGVRLLQDEGRIRILLLSFSCLTQAQDETGTSAPLIRPNVIVIVADDLGWSDLSYHGSEQIRTPNIDTLAYDGVILQQYYTDSTGTSARSAFFTGKYAFQLGTQGPSITAVEDRGVPIREKLLPSYLSEIGYRCHLVGKWGLGKSREHFLPNNRGFDTFFGFLDDSIDYYTYQHVEQWNNTMYYGLDMYNNYLPVGGLRGHATDVFTDHSVQLIREHNFSMPLYLHVAHAAPHAGGALVNLQPPLGSIAANEHIAHSARRLYAGLVTSLDFSVGRIVSALAERDALQNSIIIFMSDNGAAPEGFTQNFGLNLPFRGKKSTPWEGGVRSPALIWNPQLPSSHIWQGLFHVTDWLPTIMTAVGATMTISEIDGINHWRQIIADELSQRSELVIGVDDLSGWIGLRQGDYKIIIGELSDEEGKYFGRDLTTTIFNATDYETTILESETARVLRETLSITIDIVDANQKRRDMTFTDVNENTVIRCLPNKDKGCLYNLAADPLELNDIWDTESEIVQHLTLRLRTLWMTVKSRQEPKLDERSSPALHNYAWAPWLANNSSSPEPLLKQRPFPLLVSRKEMEYLVKMNLETLQNRIVSYLQGVSSSIVKSVGSLFLD